MSITNLNEEQVKSVLSWPLVYDAIEQSLRSVATIRTSGSQPVSNQPTRIFTHPPSGNGALLTMPGFIGNYTLKHTGHGNEENRKIFNTLACKLVTAFAGNRTLNPPKPNIIGNIFMFSELTGEMRAIIAATEITAWRTAGASLVATDYLYFKRPQVNPNTVKVAIVGCGVQGRVHALGLCSLFNIGEIRLWNRTEERATHLAEVLKGNKNNFKNANVQICVVKTVAECVCDADIVCTVTSSHEALLYRSMLKANVHINAVGAGASHISEINRDVYSDKTTQIYVDNLGSAETELALIYDSIVGEVGDLINGAKELPTNGITIFHSMGMAVEDAAVAEAVLEKYLNNL